VETFINSTNQRSILTKLQTTLRKMTVSMEATRRGQAGFEISKTVRFSGTLCIIAARCNATSI